MIIMAMIGMATTIMAKKILARIVMISLDQTLKLLFSIQCWSTSNYSKIGACSITNIKFAWEYFRDDIIVENT